MKGLLFSEFSELSRNSTGSWLSGAKVNWPEVHSLSWNSFSMNDQKFPIELPGGADFTAHKLTDGRLDAGSRVLDIATCGDGICTDVDSQSVTAASQRTVQVLSFCCLDSVFFCACIYIFIFFIIKQSFL